MQKKIYSFFLISLLSVIILPLNCSWADTSTVTTSSVSTPNDQTCVTVTTAQVEQLFNRWNASLQTLDPAKVAANYASNAVLLPTVSNQPRTNTAEIKAYFVDFLKKHPVGTINQRTIRIGCNWASDTGLYTFQVTENGEQKRIKARYSFVYEYINGQWLIVHHHSSAMPEAIEENEMDE